MVRLSQCKNKRTVIDNNILLTRNRALHQMNSKLIVLLLRKQVLENH